MLSVALMILKTDWCPDFGYFDIVLVCEVQSYYSSINRRQDETVPSLSESEQLIEYVNYKPWRSAKVFFVGDVHLISVLKYDSH